jgi:hypothetical protein
MKKAILAVVVVVILAGAGVRAFQWYRLHQEATCVREAEEAIVYYLQNGVQKENSSESDLPRSQKANTDRTDLVEKFGAFQNLSGEGYGYPTLKLEGNRYLVAERVAHFAGKDLPLLFYVTDGRVTAPGRTAVYVNPGFTYQGNRVSLFVSHPRLP